MKGIECIWNAVNVLTRHSAPRGRFRLSAGSTPAAHMFHFTWFTG